MSEQLVETLASGSVSLLSALSEIPGFRTPALWLVNQLASAANPQVAAEATRHRIQDVAPSKQDRAAIDFWLQNRRLAEVDLDAALTQAEKAANSQSLAGREELPTTAENTASKHAGILSFLDIMHHHGDDSPFQRFTNFARTHGKTLERNSPIAEFMGVTWNVVAARVSRETLMAAVSDETNSPNYITKEAWEGHSDNLSSFINDEQSSYTNTKATPIFAEPPTNEISHDFREGTKAHNSKRNYISSYN